MANTEQLIKDSEDRINNMQSDIDFTLQENTQGQQQAEKNLQTKKRIIQRKLELGKNITDQELEDLKRIKVQEIKSMVIQGQEISDAQLQFLQTNLTKPITPEDEKKIKDIQGDFGLRFQEGFLENPQKKMKLLEARLKSKFPERDIKVIDLEGNTAFSIDGQNFALLDPKGSEGLGEAGEQVGRFIEPALDIGAAFTPLGPVFGAGVVSAGAQAIREGIEANIGDEQDLGGRTSDVLLKGVTGLATGKLGDVVGKGLGGLAGKGARASVRELTDVNAASKKGAQVLQEKGTREIEEKFLKGSNPEKFAGFVQRRSQKFVNTMTGKAKKAFDAGRKLAEKEGIDVNNVVNVTDQLDEFAKTISSDPAKAKNVVDGIQRVLQKEAKAVGKTINDAADLTSLSPRETIALREHLNNLSKSITNNSDLSKDAIVGLKTSLNEVLEQQASQGSKAASQYAKGIKVTRELNERFPDFLQKKVLGKGAEFPSQFDKVTEGEFLKKLRGEGLDSSELAKIRDFTGIGGRKSAQKLATKNLIADTIDQTGIGLPRSNVRLQNITPEAIEQAEKFTNVSQLDELQKRGLKITGDEFGDIVNPSNVSNVKQTDFNFSPVVKKLQKRAGGLSSGDSVAGRALGDAESFDQAFDLIADTADKQLQAQGKAIQFGDDPLAFAGRNTLNVTANVPVLNKLLGTLTDGDALKRGFELTGRVPEAIPDLARLLGKAGGGATGAVLERAAQEIPARDLTEAQLEEELRRKGNNPALKLISPLKSSVSFTEGIDRR